MIVALCRASTSLTRCGRLQYVGELSMLEYRLVPAFPSNLAVCAAIVGLYATGCPVMVGCALSTFCLH